MQYSKYVNPAQMVSNAISELHTNKITMFPKPGLDKEERLAVENDSKIIFEEVRSGKLDFVTDTLAAHIIILGNISTVCHKKASSSDHFIGFTELSIKASDQLRKSGLALAQIKNVILNIENLTIQQHQNNILQLDQATKPCDTNPIPESANVKKVV